MNVFQGVLSEDSAGDMLLLDGGVKLPLGRRISSSNGRRVVFGIRPEHIRLFPTELVQREHELMRRTSVDSQGNHQKIPSEIDVVEPLGKDVIVTARSAAGVFQMQTEIYAGLRPSQRVDLWFDMNRAYLFDQETEWAI
jgi:ABC-type sugar transport system ATPase subunit